MNDEVPHWLDKPGNVKRLRNLFVAVLALTVLIEAAVHLHPHFKIEGVFGFHAWFGLASCAAMIVVARGLGLLLKRPDRYYGRDDD
ncbi:MAG: hypothetical protein ABIN08_02465 [Caldimonas sp.]